MREQPSTLLSLFNPRPTAPRLEDFLLRRNFPNEPIRQLAHRARTVAVHISHPQLLVDEVHTGRIDTSRSDELSLTVLPASLPDCPQLHSICYVLSSCSLAYFTMSPAKSPCSIQNDRKPYGNTSPFLMQVQ